jgi:protein CpxP
MKKVTITFILLLCTVIGFSQQPPPPPKMPTPEQIAQREANALSQRLSLTEEQRSKAYTIYLDKAKKDLADREALMKEMQKRRDQASAEAKQQSDKINQLLNADQKKTYQDMQAQRSRPAVPGDLRGMRQGPQQRGFQRGPGGQFQGPGGQGPRRPGGQFQRPYMRPNFQGRPGGPGGFRQGPPAGPQGRPFRQELRNRFQNRMNRFPQPPNPPVAPDNSK